MYEAAGTPLRLESFPLPKLAAGEVLVRVRCCTVCGSDVHTYNGDRQTPVPTVLGHEILGDVAALGPGGVVGCDGRPLREGDRVTWSVAANCGDCFYCGHAIPQKCERLFKYGHERVSDHHPLSGGLSEYCHLAKGTAVLAVPPEVPDLVACPANCATATVAGAWRLAGGCRDEVVLIQGAGMLGLTACAMAQAGGAKEVIVCDVDAERLRAASEFGATRCVLIEPDGAALASAVEDATDGRGVDVAMELCGAPEAFEAGLDLLRIGGRCVLVGAVFPARPAAIEAEKIVRRLLTIRGLHNYTPDDLRSAMAFLAEHHHRYPFLSLVSRQFGLDEAEAAFQYSLAQKPARVAVVP